jgi:hypothetical protein
MLVVSLKLLVHVHTYTCMHASFFWVLVLTREHQALYLFNCFTVACALAVSNATSVENGFALDVSIKKLISSNFFVLQNQHMLFQNNLRNQTKLI